MNAGACVLRQCTLASQAGRGLCQAGGGQTRRKGVVSNQSILIGCLDVCTWSAKYWWFCVGTENIFYCAVFVYESNYSVKCSVRSESLFRYQLWRAWSQCVCLCVCEVPASNWFIILSKFSLSASSWWEELGLSPGLVLAGDEPEPDPVILRFRKYIYSL